MMPSYDTVNSWLPYDYFKSEQQVEALLGTLTSPTSVNNEATGTSYRGMLDNLIVYISNFRIKVYGSLCKYYHGSNVHSLQLKDVKLAIEKLSDQLHLPMNLATVTRFDLAHNMSMAHPVSLYLPYLGIAKAYERLEKGSSVYYQRGDRQLVFYDKGKEVKRFKEKMPEHFAGHNLLRYETRYTKGTRKQFKTELPLSLLADAKFYAEAVKRWHDEYAAISKNREFNFKAPGYNIIENHKDLAYIALIEKLGGERKALEQIDHQSKTGDFTYMQVKRAKDQIKKHCSLPNLTYQCDLIEELNAKILEATQLL